MKSFLVTIDPSPLDLHQQSPLTDELNLKRLWNTFNLKAHKLLQQGTRIDNLFWRRWHLEQKEEKEKEKARKDKEMNSHHHQHHVQYPSPSHYGHNVAPSNGVGMSHYERLNEAGRQATRDLEAFLSNTLQAAQPPTIPNPPTFPPVPPSPYSQLQQNLTNASPSVPHAQYPSPAPPPHIVAPQPHRPLQQQQQQYNPSPEWAYTALPPMSSQPPSMPPVSSSQSRIIATPSWTALISDSMPHPSMTSSTIPHLYPPPNVPPPPQPHHQQQASPYPYPHPPTYPQQHHPYSYVTPSLAHPQPMHPASFTLPPSATLFSDLPSALSSAAPNSTGPPAFYSSYGVYQPIHTPYPRFLTPSPEPSILGELDLDGLGTAGVADYESVIGGGNGLNGIAEEGGGVGGDEEMNSVWQEFSPINVVETHHPSSLPNSVTSQHSVGEENKRDPFEGMSLAQIRSRANSLEAVDRDERRYESFGAHSGLNASDRAAFEVRDQVNGGVKGKSKRKNSTESNGGGGGGGKKSNFSNGTSPYTHDSQPLHLDSTSPTLSSTADESSPPTTIDGVQKSANSLLGKKNRNPHATQLPGNGQRKLPKEEAGEGHQGPICSHCASITTPLWRRGPDDELLCNACGLYLKLHSKPRPKTFGKGASGTKRSMNGAAAKAAASGIPPVCSNCACTSTPMWRVLEGKLSCNACSLYFKLHKVPRPASLAQKRAAAAAAKVNLAAAASCDNPPSTTSSPGDRPATLEPIDSKPTPSKSTPATSGGGGGGGEAQMTSPSTSTNPSLQPAVMPPPHARTQGMMLPPSIPPPSSHTPQNWPRTATTSPYLDASLSLTSEPNPFAQTSWGALAYQLVSAAAEEEAGQVDGATGSGGGGLLLSETNGDATSR